MPRPPPFLSETSLLLPYQGFVTEQELSNSRFNREFKGVTTPSDWHSAEVTNLASGIPFQLRMTKQGNEKAEPELCSRKKRGCDTSSQVNCEERNLLQSTGQGWLWTPAGTT